MCCCRDGYTEAQIMAVSARYDVDVCRGVSRAELRKMQADLSRQKVSLQWLSFTFLDLVFIYACDRRKKKHSENGCN